jgi:integrase/recombinase XerD
MMRKLFKISEIPQWKILAKEIVDEIIFRTTKPRNRLILELMARGGMRIGEVLKLTPADVDERKLTLRDPKSGRGQEVVFIPQKIADRLKEYIREKGIKPEGRIFPITYTAARAMVKKFGLLAGVHLPRTTSGDMRPPLPHGQGFLLSWSARSSSAMPIFQRPRGTSERAAMWRQ